MLGAFKINHSLTPIICNYSNYLFVIICNHNPRAGISPPNNIPPVTDDLTAVWGVCEVENIIVPYLRQFIRPIFFGGLEDKQDEVIEAAQKLSEEFSLLNGVLADRDWLAGDKLSAADIVTYPMLKFIERAATKEQAQELNLDLLPFAEKYPKLGKWLQKIEEIPGVRDTYPPHWR